MVKIKRIRKGKRYASHTKNSISSEYGKLLSEVKDKIRIAQIKASLSVNRELILLYLYIGKQILNRQEKEGWGKSIVERLSKDLQQEFSAIKGFSPRNLWDMRRLHESCKNHKILRQLVAEIPWGHNLVLLNSVKDITARVWYIQKTMTHGWSRNVLVHQIESGLYHRKGKALTNFRKTLLSPQADLAQQMIKDPYYFDFLTIDEYALRDTRKPIGVAEYKLTKTLPKDFKGNLPTIKELETEISQTTKKGKKK